MSISPRRNGIYKKCICGISFYIPKHRIKTVKYCSMNCQRQHRQYNVNDGTFKKGLKPWNKGLIGYRAGSLSHLWKGGITPVLKALRNSTKFKEWRTAVFKRDNFTCQICGDNRGGNLEADHIKPFAYFPDLRFLIDNGRTLCRECHKQTNTYARKCQIMAKELGWQ